MNKQLSQITELIAIARWIGDRGWCPATGGNFSLRLENNLCLVTASGVDKANLQEDDFLVVQLTGEIQVGNKKPSAETLLHTALYALSEEIGAVLHTHTVAATVLSNLVKANNLQVRGYEMQKALSNITTHETTVNIPILNNNQNISQLAEELQQRWLTDTFNYGFLVRGHGLYAWGKDLPQAKRHLEGIEFLLSCQLNQMLLEANYKF
jgi:methylthioribulose-1-phosphate dehydratase